MELKVIDSEKFECCQCGSCCANIRGIMPKESSNFLEQMAFGKLPIVQLVPVNKMTFTLWDWEARRFREWEKERGIDARIKPFRSILDLDSNRAIVVSYFMDSTACPFLEDKKCKIYDKKRAYICRLFPFQRSPFLHTGQELQKNNIFGKCDSLGDIAKNIPDNKNEMISYLSKTFPDGSFENAVQFDHISEFVNKKIIELIKEKKLRPAINYPYDMFLKRFENSEKIDFTDFLLEKEIIKDKEELIKQFDNNEDAKEKIKN
ncbi:YkgJ family cysteine cluster protein [Candidatus Woesearchaeota archaeon]|nr:YkgJ family cysteine cluster protein [Candidatus Woesearchaeota archaeon]